MGSTGGTVHAHVREDGLVSVDMGVPEFRSARAAHGAAGGGALAEAPTYSLNVEGAEMRNRRGVHGQSACRAQCFRRESRAGRAVWA